VGTQIHYDTTTDSALVNLQFGFMEFPRPNVTLPSNGTMTMDGTRRMAMAMTMIVRRIPVETIVGWRRTMRKIPRWNYLPFPMTMKRGLPWEPSDST
jgi:hypothetical protein